jgi:exosome complex RNA-binding protein Csl4
MSNDSIVEPGTVLATSEELLPGAGTYDDGENIRAALYGSEYVDPETMEVSIVSPGHTVVSIEKGDIVVGEITYLKDDLGSVKLSAVRGKQGSMLQQTDATLRVRNVADRFVARMQDELSCGDIIRAKVLSTKGGPQLAIDNDDMGVIRAHSKLDGTRALVRDGNKLVDPEDGHQETRKFASDYGSGVV